MQVKAVLIASGDPHRLRPLTTNIPPPLLPIANRPVMTYTIELLIRHDMRHILVSLQHLPGQIETFFRSGRRWGAKLDYHLQRDPLSTAGTLKRLQNQLTNTFVVFNADTLLDLDLTHALEQHLSQQSIATIVMHTNSRPLSAKNGRYTQQYPSSATNKNGAGLWQSTHTYIFEPEILAYLQSDQPVETENDLLNTLTSSGLPIHTYHMQGYYNPLNTFQQYHDAQFFILNNSSFNTTNPKTEKPIRYLSITNKEIRRGIWVHPQSSVHPTAKLLPPVLIAENCQISKNVVIGPEVIIGSDVFVAPEATIQHSTVLGNTYLGQLVHVENRVVYNNLLVDIPTGEFTYTTDHFLLGKTRDRIDDMLRRFFDITCATVGLILVSPLLFVLGLWLFVTTGNGFQKVMHEKRRSYNDTAVSNHKYQLTHLNIYMPGKQHQFLQKLIYSWEIYRLPELWDVLCGVVNFIGTKPLTPATVAALNAEWQLGLDRPRPGFTGLWYIMTDPTSCLDDILITDAYYQATRSWLEDIKLTLKTPLAWAKKLYKPKPFSLNHNQSETADRQKTFQ